MLAHTGVYFGASVINRALPFALLPVLTRYLSPGEYGAIALYQAMVGVLIPLVGLDLHVNVTRMFFKIDRKALARLFGNLIAVLSATLTIALLILGAAVAWRGDLLGLPAGWTLSLPLVAAMQVCNQLNLVRLRNQRRPFVYGALEIGATGLNAGLSVALVVMGYGWQGRAMGIAIAAVIAGAVALSHLRRDGLLELNTDAETTRQALRVSIPMVPHALGSVAILYSDRLLLLHLSGAEAVGLYTVAYQIGLVVSLLNESVNKVWSPWIYQQLAAPNERRRYQIVVLSYGLFALTALVAVGYGLVAPILLGWLATPAYQVAGPFILWIALGYGLRGMYMVVFPYFVEAKRTELLAAFTLLAALLNIAANLVLIPRYGPLGAAQATAIAFGVQLVLTFTVARRVYPMPWGLFTAHHRARLRALRTERGLFGD